VGLLDDHYAVLDFETTGGLATGGGEVIETGAVHLECGGIGAAFHAWSRPLRPVSAPAARVHGIGDAQVVDAPRFSEVLPCLLDFLGDRVVVAHQAGFDRSFLDAALAREGRPAFANPVLDTVRLSRALGTHGDAHDLASACVRHGIRHEEPHRALSDARATARLLAVLLGLAEERGIVTRAALLAVAGCARRDGPRGPAEPALPAAGQRLLEQALVTGDRVQICYRTAAGSVRSAAIVPSVIDRVGGRPRLVAYDVDRGLSRCFRLDRVLGARPSEG
jgi:DNA polymerase III epsilon subunit family exonuclease